LGLEIRFKDPEINSGQGTQYDGVGGCGGMLRLIQHDDVGTGAAGTSSLPAGAIVGAVPCDRPKAGSSAMLYCLSKINRRYCLKHLQPIFTTLHEGSHRELPLQNAAVCMLVYEKLFKYYSSLLSKETLNYVMI
jgi:hypothetical protein